MENANTSTRSCWGTPGCLPPPDPLLPQDGSTAAPPTRRSRHQPRPPSTSAATEASPRATSRTRASRTRTPSPTASASGEEGVVESPRLPTRLHSTVRLASSISRLPRAGGVHTATPPGAPTRGLRPTLVPRTDGRSDRLGPLGPPVLCPVYPMPSLYSPCYRDKHSERNMPSLA